MNNYTEILSHAGHKINYVYRQKPTMITHPYHPSIKTDISLCMLNLSI